MSLTATEERFKAFFDSTMGPSIMAEGDIGVFTSLMAALQTQTYADIQRFPELRDLDKVPADLLDLYRREFASQFPASTPFDIREFIRESKNWYSGKGTSDLLGFIGSLFGVDLKMFETSKLILRFSDSRTLISGRETDHFLSYPESRLGRIRDGIIWSYYVYFLIVNGIQNVPSLADFLDVVRLNHPAGTQFFTQGEMHYSLPADEVTDRWTRIWTEYDTIVEEDVEVLIYLLEFDRSNYIPSYNSLAESQLMNAFGQADLYGTLTLGEKSIVSEFWAKLQDRTYVMDATSPLGPFMRFVKVLNTSLDSSGPFSAVEEALITRMSNTVIAWDPSTERYRFVHKSDSVVATHLSSGANIRDYSYDILSQMPYEEIATMFWAKNPAGGSGGEFNPYMLGCNIIITPYTPSEPDPRPDILLHFD